MSATLERPLAPRVRAFGDRPETHDWPKTARVVPWLIALFLAMMFLIPFDSIDLPVHLPVNSALDRFALGILFLGWVLAGARSASRPRFRHAPINVANFAFVTLCVVSIGVNFRDLAWDGELGLALKQTSLVISYLALFYIASTSIRRREIVSFARLTVALAVLTAVGTIYQYRTGANLFAQFAHLIFPFAKIVIQKQPVLAGARVGASGPTRHPLAATALLSAAVPLALVLASRARSRREEWLMLLATIVLLGACMSTGRKTAVIVPAISILVLVLYNPRRYVRYWPGLLVAVVVIRLLAPHAISAVIYQLQHVTNSSSTQTRTSDYGAVAPTIASHLLFGRGYGSFDPVKYRILDDQMLGFLVSIGIFGALSYAGIMLGSGITVHHAARRAQTTADSLMGAVAAVAVGYFVSNFLYDTFGYPQGPYVFFWIAALGAAYAGLTSEEEELLSYVATTGRGP